jgi:hypothetical protein
MTNTLLKSSLSTSSTTTNTAATATATSTITKDNDSRLYRGELNEVDVANGYGMGMATVNRGNKVS